MTGDTHDAARERLAGLIAQAAAGRRPVALILVLTSSGGLHHVLGSPPGTLGRLAGGPDKHGLAHGVLHLSVAESPYIEAILAYLLVAVVADLAANPPEPLRFVGEVYFDRVDEAWHDPQRQHSSQFRTWRGSA